MPALPARLLLTLTCIFSGMAYGQAVRLQGATTLVYPVPMVDGNSPGIWVDGTLRVYTSTGDPVRMAGPNLLNLRQVASPVVTPRDHYPIWIESVWRDPEDGLVYGWYHHEPGGICSRNKLTAPVIGALVSEDGGETFRDLGVVLSTGNPLNCNAGNGFFAGGHGDFSVIPDREHKFFYFLFDNYSGPIEHQGVAIARMAFEDRANPVGAVRKFYSGEWNEPGIGGYVSPIFRSAASWEGSNNDSFWGPSIHWNTHIESYVVVLNRACCETNWPQEGIYLSMNADLTNPGGWSSPEKILDARSIGFAPGYYPQVVGTGEGETDSLAGGTARLFVKGVSKWELVFLNEDEIPDPELPPDPSGPPDPNYVGPNLIRLRPGRQ